MQSAVRVHLRPRRRLTCSLRKPTFLAKTPFHTAKPRLGLNPEPPAPIPAFMSGAGHQQAFRHERRCYSTHHSKRGGRDLWYLRRKQEGMLSEKDIQWLSTRADVNLLLALCSSSSNENALVAAAQKLPASGVVTLCELMLREWGSHATSYAMMMKVIEAAIARNALFSTEQQERLSSLLLQRTGADVAKSVSILLQSSRQDYARLVDDVGNALEHLPSSATADVTEEALRYERYVLAASLNPRKNNIAKARAFGSMGCWVEGLATLKKCNSLCVTNALSVCLDANNLVAAAAVINSNVAAPMSTACHRFHTAALSRALDPVETIACRHASSKIMPFVQSFSSTSVYPPQQASLPSNLQRFHCWRHALACATNSNISLVQRGAAAATATTLSGMSLSLLFPTLTLPQLVVELLDTKRLMSLTNTPDVDVASAVEANLTTGEEVYFAVTSIGRRTRHAQPARILFRVDQVNAFGSHQIVRNYEQPSTKAATRWELALGAFVKSDEKQEFLRSGSLANLPPFAATRLTHAMIDDRYPANSINKLTRGLLQWESALAACLGALQRGCHVEPNTQVTLLRRSGTASHLVLQALMHENEAMGRSSISNFARLDDTGVEEDTLRLVVKCGGHVNHHLLKQVLETAGLTTACRYLATAQAEATRLASIDINGAQLLAEEFAKSRSAERCLLLKPSVTRRGKVVSTAMRGKNVKFRHCGDRALQGTSWCVALSFFGGRVSPSVAKMVVHQCDDDATLHALSKSHPHLKLDVSEKLVSLDSWSTALHLLDSVKQDSCERLAKLRIAALERSPFKDAAAVLAQATDNGV